ncbi:MAG: SDR family NAD(P)-dependent oxidoreductase [Candidatus Heimdallarchaeota archaeon]|nr:SDR family NAD(P)-dependent oxidoreductase [Candidatus Heimdallarchaeota archaeon]
MKNSSKVVLVTGAAHGIGQAITEYLASKGDIVIASDCDEEGLAKFDCDQKIHTVVMDVTDPKNIEEAVEVVKGITEGVDCLVNNAGLFIGGPLVEVELVDFEKIFDVNVLGYVRVTKAFFPLLKARKGRVVNMSSEVGRIAFPFNGPYSMTKYSVEAFTDSLRREFMFLDMKVIAIQPGAIDTSLPEKTVESYQKYLKDSEFETEMSRVWKVLGKERYADPKYVAKKVFKAIHKRNPRRRYRVKNNKQRKLLEFFPESWADYFIKKFI